MLLFYFYLSLTWLYCTSYCYAAYSNPQQYTIFTYTESIKTCIEYCLIDIDKCVQCSSKISTHFNWFANCCCHLSSIVWHSLCVGSFENILKYYRKIILFWTGLKVNTKINSFEHCQCVNKFLFCSLEKTKQQKTNGKKTEKQLKVLQLPFSPPSASSPSYWH